MKTVFVVYGTRPEAIKLIPLFVQRDELRAAGIELKAIFTGQHKDLVRPIHDRFAVQPDADLQIMTPGQNLNQICVRTINGLESLFEKQLPAGVVVQGDTTSCFAASVAAFYRRIPVFHVEAGLRSGDIFSPYPEEFNRRGVSLTASLHFAPTEQAAKLLLDERIPKNQIVVTGNTAIDALRLALQKANGFTDSQLADFYTRSEGKKVLLVTLHRREIFGEQMEKVLQALHQLVHARADLHVLLFAHPNPNVQQAIQKVFAQIPKNLLIAAPTDYFNFIECMRRSYLILTDSGGIQEEAPHLGVPVLVARQVTERPEAVAAGSSILAGVEKEKLVSLTNQLLDDQAKYQKMAQSRNPYGDGFATQKIFSAIKTFLA